MVEFEETKGKIKWGDGDVEAAPPLRRQRSASEMSIRSVRSRRASIDPSVALPPQFRTLSYQIDEAKGGPVKSQKAKDSAAKELADLDWHTISDRELFTRLSTSLNQGLASEQASRKLGQYGKNEPSPPPTHYLKSIFGYLFRGFGSILLLGSILVFISWKPLGNPPADANLALAIVLLAVFFIQAGFNAWQDWSSSRVMASITTMLPDNCLVLRDGAQVTLVATEIVPGDVLFIKAGNKLPADVRFVEVSNDARFDRSILTGESVPLPGSINSTDNNYLETKCIGMQGTHCVSGSAMGIVVATGDATVFGRIAKMTNTPKTGFTPLEKEIINFVIIITSIMVTMITIVVVVWATYIRKKYPDWISVPYLIVCCVSVAIAFIPEGLPIALTASLTITANLMRKNKILCKSLKTVETLGSVSVICSDKTGTLTENKMYVTECSIGLECMSHTEARDEMLRREGVSTTSNAVSQLRSLTGLCNAGNFDAATSHQPLHERKIIGDATDQAVLRFSESLGPVSDLRNMWKKTFELAFNSKNKFMIRTHKVVQLEGRSITLSAEEAKSFDDNDTLLSIKGAPDVLLPRCSRYITIEGQVASMDDGVRNQIEDIKNKWSSRGKRVILLARKIVQKEFLQCEPTSTQFEEEVSRHARHELIVVGIVGIVDPPREEIPSVVATLRRAGIRIFMVTGDFALTAQAIAADCGIITTPSDFIDNITALSREERSSVSSNTSSKKAVRFSNEVRSSIVISGPEMITLNDFQWDQLCRYDEIVFARTTPEQKLRIVSEFQKRDEIVAMTGDGVNDAPSLKKADIGIALGSGSDIAIEAADMVLLESFSAIVEAVQYGRVVFDNLKKTIAYLLPAGSFSEFWPVMTNVIFGIPQILSSFLMIIICCFTDCAAATVLAYEAPEADVLLRKPRKPGQDRLVDWKLILQAYGFVGVAQTICSFAVSYWYLERNGIPFSNLWFKYALPEDLPAEYVAEKLNVASSIYFVNLVVMQFFNLLMTRTRRLSIIQHPPLFNKRTQNVYLFPAMLFALVMAFFWLYPEPFQRVLLTARVPVEFWFMPAGFGLGLLILDEGRRFVVRKWPNGLLAKIAW